MFLIPPFWRVKCDWFALEAGQFLVVIVILIRLSNWFDFFIYMDMSKSFLAKSWKTLFYSIVIVNEKMRVHDSTMVPFVCIAYNLVWTGGFSGH